MWEKANPLIPYSPVLMEDLHEAYKRIKLSPAELRNFKIKRVNLIHEKEESFIVQCNLCKKEIIIKKIDCIKVKDGYEVNHEIECTDCRNKDSIIIDYNKMLKRYNNKEKHKNKLLFEQAKKDYYYEQKRKENSVIRCPNCNSNNTNKIGTANKATSVIFMGIFSIGKLLKVYECRSCGYRW